MFEDYSRLLDAFAANQLGAGLQRLKRDRMAHPWTGVCLDGHVPFVDFGHASDILRPIFRQRGLYVWGAWAGERTRIQYVGISTKLGGRFGNRYIAGPRSRTRPSALHREINLAAAFAESFQRLADDFSPLREAVNADRYRSETIPVRPSQITRRPRAERYAKVGLANLWYYLIPAPPTVTKGELEAIESALVKVANAELCERWSRGDSLSWPLLNVIHAQDATNPHVPPREHARYSDWIAGAWHRDRATSNDR